MSRISMPMSTMAVVLAFSGAGTAHPGLAAMTTEQPSYKTQRGDIPASERTLSEVGVATWRISQKDGYAVVVAVGSTGDPVLSLIAKPVAGSTSRIVVQALTPASGTLEVDRNGTVSGDAPESLTRVTRALLADVQDNRMRALRRSSQAFTNASDVYVEEEGTYELGWSPWGYNGEVTVGNFCHNHSRIRAGADARARGGIASCWVVGWETWDPRDCRIKLHYGIPGWRWDACLWTTYVHP